MRSISVSLVNITFLSACGAGNKKPRRKRGRAGTDVRRSLVSRAMRVRNRRHGAGLLIALLQAAVHGRSHRRQTAESQEAFNS